MDFKLVKGNWMINKNGYGSGVTTATVNSNLTGNSVDDVADAEDNGNDENESIGKIIPYESSNIHLGFDVARMSMSDKGIIQSILYCWTGQVDVTLLKSGLSSRYLVLYHAHLLTDESILQIQECLEKYENFKVLMTTELPICTRISDYIFEIPCGGEDLLLKNFIADEKLKWGEYCFRTDIWREFFLKTAEHWSMLDSYTVISDVRNWIYICLQRNLRWADVVQYWIEALWEISWINIGSRSRLFELLSTFESGGGWNLIPSYRIPIIWEKNHLEFARLLQICREDSKSLTLENDK
jgi:hypothetical protein